MVEYWTFERFLEFAKSYSYELKGSWGPYRVFINTNKPKELPWLIPVYERKIDIEYVKKFKIWLKHKGLLRNEDEADEPEAFV